MEPVEAQPCEYLIEGNPDGPTLVFVHGWPDDASLWRKQVSALERDYRCVLVTLPNFGEAPVRGGGLDFPEVVEMLAATVRTDRRGDEAVILVTHDWGAYCGYLLEHTHPDLIRGMIAMDVGGHLEPVGLRTRVLIAGYQWTLILLWLIGGVLPPLGNGLTRLFGGLLGVPENQRSRIRSRANYLYFYFWRAMLWPGFRQSLLRQYRPQCPVLYLYGERKPFMFHSEQWLDTVAATGGRSESVDAGHWFMLSRPDAVNATVRAWLAEWP